jgi:serine/threonine protein kinase
MQLSSQRVMELFCEALTRPSPEALGAYLTEACGDDAVLRGRIEDLLRANNEAGRFLEGAAGAVPDGPGRTIGPYKLLEQIGEGGFGIVFMAEQTSPVRRRVALKIVKPGMDSRRIVARFEAERQALALMEHANIARVLDAGQTESGRPYFVMELVRGTPLTEFCDQNRLPPRTVGAVSFRLPGGSARARQGDRSPRSEALERARDDARRYASGQSDRLRHRQGAG